MNIKKQVPIIIYDNQCYLCVKFAKIIEFLTKGNLSMIGHYSESGINFRGMLGKSALEMFWIIDEKTAYGGRAALLPLFKAMIKTFTMNSKHTKLDQSCEQKCKTVKSVFIRSASLFSNSKRIDF